MAPVTPRAGQHAPDFTLVDADGETRRLSGFVMERPLVLLFYRAHW